MNRFVLLSHLLTLSLKENESPEDVAENVIRTHPPGLQKIDVSRFTLAVVSDYKQPSATCLQLDRVTRQLVRLSAVSRLVLVILIARGDNGDHLFGLQIQFSNNCLSRGCYFYCCHRSSTLSKLRGQNRSLRAPKERETLHNFFINGHRPQKGTRTITIYDHDE